MHGEAALVGGFTHDLDGGLKRGGGPVDEPAGEALVSEDVPDRVGQVHAEQGGLPPSRSCHEAARTGHGDQQAGSVGNDESLTSLIFLPAS